MTEPERQPPDIAPVAIEEEMRRSYLDYAMSVIVARALPDVRDGLKPVHRRILHAMKEGGYDWSRPYRKSARIVGDVMGQYHPHGDSAIYDAMVRMAQDFSMRLPLVDGQGNFGSMDGDPPAAHRYTEARLARPAEALLRDIDKETVDFVPNYDETAEEPSVLPAEFPNLLVNGAGGIAVGMATNIPPHNLGETIDACLAYIDNPGITVEELMEHLPGPDFPTGGVVLGRAGIHAAYRTGRGSIVVRARARFEEVRKDRWAIVVSEIPYQVNKARLMERIAEAARDKTVEGIADLRDESDRDGVRVVVELKRDAGQDEAAREVALAQLYRFTPMQTTFGVNMLALNAGRPEQMDLRAVVAAFVAFREEVVARRTRFLLRRARERAHVLAGLLAALANLDAVIAEIRAAADAPAARRALRARAWPAGEVADFIAIVDDPGHKVEDGRYRLSDAQARAILELRLQRLTGMERAKLVEETRELAARIAGHLEILGSRPRLLAAVRAELEAARDAHADPRRTLLEENEFEHDIEDLIPREDMVVTVSLGGYAKRVPLAAYRAQRRGGRGRSGMSTRAEDAVSRLFVANTHAPILFFTSRGVVYRMKAYRLPLAAPQARGKAIVNLLPLEPGEWIQAVMPTPADNGDGDGGPEAPHLMFATAAGTVRRNALSDFERIARTGKIAMRLEEGDRLIDVRPCAGGDDVLLATRGGRAARFAASDVRVFRGRGSTGVRGVRLAPGDEVVSMSILRGPAEDAAEDNADAPPPGPSILTVTETGMGKRAPAAEYRRTGRGAQGVLNIDAAGRAGRVVAAFPVEDGDHVMLVTDAGQTIRCAAGEVRETGRRSMGVRVFRLGEGERVVSAGPVSEPGADQEPGSETAPAPEPGPSRDGTPPPTD